LKFILFVFAPFLALWDLVEEFSEDEVGEEEKEPTGKRANQWSKAETRRLKEELRKTRTTRKIGWKHIAQAIGTRNPTQAKAKCQKYLGKLRSRLTRNEVNDVTLCPLYEEVARVYREGNGTTDPLDLFEQHVRDADRMVELTSFENDGDSMSLTFTTVKRKHGEE